MMSVIRQTHRRRCSGAWIDLLVLMLSYSLFLLYMAGEHPHRGGLPEPQMQQARPLLGGGRGTPRRLRPQQARGEEGRDILLHHFSAV